MRNPIPTHLPSPCRLAWAVIALALLLGGAGPAFAQDATPAAAEPAGTIYALTNNFTRNEVLAYDRAEDGTLTAADRFDTGGQGSGGYEASTNMLIVGSVDGQSSPIDLGGGNDLVFAANAGSDTISVFQVTDDGLKLIEQQDSGGERPTSLTLNHGLLYVLNSGGTETGAGLCLAGKPSITGFTVAKDGKLDPIADSTQELSGGASSACAELSFNPAGDTLIVSQWIYDRIDTFTVGEDGVAKGPTANKTTGFGPFGFAFDAKGRLLTSENDQQLEGEAGVASYKIGDDGKLTPIGKTVKYGETDPCWMVVSPDGRYAYVAAFGPSPIAQVKSPASRRGVISSFQIGDDGVLEALDPQAANVGIGVSDMAMAGDGHFLYAINSFEGTIKGFAVGDDGSLKMITAVGGLPINPFAPLSSGLAARDNG
jgi:6-phosphogluconolactonase